MSEVVIVTYNEEDKLIPVWERQGKETPHTYRIKTSHCAVEKYEYLRNIVWNNMYVQTATLI